MNSIRTVAFGTEAAHRYFLLDVANELKRRTGCRVLFYVNSMEALNVYRRYVTEGVIDDVRLWDIFLAEALRIDVNRCAVVAESNYYEDIVGLSLFRSVMMTKRTYGRGFALAGYYHPKSSAAEALTYEQCLAGINGLLRFWEKEIVDEKIDLVVHGPREAALMADALRVPHRALCISRYKTYYYWAEDIYWTFPRLKDAFLSVPQPQKPLELEQPYLQEVMTRTAAFEGISISNTVKTCLRFVVRQIYLFLKSYKPQGAYKVSDVFCFYFRRRAAIRKLMDASTCTLANMGDRPFVFYPLQTEPESTLQWISPETFGQLEIIAALARDLPAGVVLAVKETVHGCGRRPPAFYDQIRAFKNVVMLDIREVGQNVIRKCSAVASINGTAAIEAAFLGKPVLSFGHHNAYDFLPHVRRVCPSDDLRKIYLELMQIDYEKAALDGARLRDAIVSISFDMGSYSMLSPKSYGVRQVEDACTYLLASIDKIAKKRG